MLDDVQNDSRSWGNYSNSVGDAAINAGDSAKPGGTNEYWKVNNIYDLAGNVHEWTQEKYSTGSNCTVRGGYCSVIGVIFPVANRGNSEEGFTDYSRRV